MNDYTGPHYNFKQENSFHMPKNNTADAVPYVHVNININGDTIWPMCDAIVLCSGGMDSVTLAHYVKKQLRRTPLILFFSYRQKALQQEWLNALACSNDLFMPFVQISLGEMGSYVKSAIVRGSSDSNKMEDTVVPGRNLLFTSMAIAIAQSNNIQEVYIGVQIGDHEGYPDCRPAFWNNVCSASLLGYNVSVRTPFLKWTKKKIVKWGNKLGVDYSKTYSCYYGKNSIACGNCPSCIVRKETGV